MRKKKRLADQPVPLLCAAVYAVAATVGVFSGGAWGGLAIGFAVIGFFVLWIRDRKPPLPPSKFTLFTLAALAFFLVELPFSYRTEASLHLWAQLVTIFLPLLLLTSSRMQAAAAAPFFIPVAALAAAIGALFLGIELQSGGAWLHELKGPNALLTEYNRGIAHLAIFAFPLFAGLWIADGRRSALALALLFLFPASLTESHTAKLALIAGLLCTVAAFYWPLMVQRILACAAILALGWPFYAQRLFATCHERIEQWHSSWRHRMEIWDYLSYRIMDRPLVGWGLGTTHMLDTSKPHGDWYQAIAVSGAPPHAHNFITELWVETGLVGLAFGLIFLLWTLRAGALLHPSLRPFAFGAWAAAFVVAMFGFDFWTDSLWGAFALSAFAFGMMQERIKRGDHIAHI